MKKLLIITSCFFLLSFLDIDKLLKDNKNKLYDKIISLEKKYNDKLLQKYSIDSNELNNKCSTQQDIANCKKQYIMESGNLTEEEYKDTFLHPIEQIKNAKDNLENTYKNVQKGINNISDLIEILSDF